MEPKPQSPPVKGVGRLEYLGAHPRQWVAEGCPWHLWLLRCKAGRSLEVRPEGPGWGTWAGQSQCLLYAANVHGTLSFLS